MINITKYIFLSLLLLSINSCAPDEFVLNKNIFASIYCRKLCQIDSVGQIAPNAVQIFDGGRLSMKFIGQTQLYSDMSAEIQSGEGLNFTFRTTSNDYPRRPSITLVYSVNGCKVFEKGKLLVENEAVRAKINEPGRIIIQNDGKYVKIRIDCVDIYSGRTDLPATEYMLIETLPGSTAKVFGIDFADILGSYDFKEIESKTFKNY